MTTEPTTVPRIYVTCLAAYNNGILHGEWIDANQPADELHSAVTAMLSRSPSPRAEEWAIHDYEGFAPLRLSEWEPFERVSAIAAGIAEHGPAFAAWLDYDSGLDPTDVEVFREAYLGEWDSLRDYAENYAEDVGLYAKAEEAGSPYVIVDIDMLTRDFDIELYVVKTDRYTVYVFDTNR